GRDYLPVRTTYLVQRPSPEFHAVIRDEVWVDANNWYFTNDRTPHPPGTYLHFGIASSPTNDGIVFMYTNATPVDWDGSSGTYSLLQVIESLHQRYNTNGNGVCTGFETNDVL